MKPHTNYSPEEALQIVLRNVQPVSVEQVSLTDALYRVLSQPLSARIEDPRFNKSAVDGIGVRADDDSVEFEVVGNIAAGADRRFSLGRGQAVRIMTGAPVPGGVGRVIKFENCVFDGSRARIVEPERIANIALRAENIRVGQPLLSPRRLLPPDIGVLASQGYSALPVYRKPRVAIIATGDEIYPTESSLPPAGIYDSNSHQLTAYARDAFAEVTNFGIIGDNPERIRDTVARAAATHDVVLLSGGVSMGDLDFVPEALSAVGAEVVFHGLAMKPGRPTLYALLPGAGHTTRFFGLPGNPVSTAVQFEFLVRPLLEELGGCGYQPHEARLPLAEDFRRRSTDRHELLPGTCRDGAVVRLAYKGSGHVSVLSEATLFFRIDRGVQSLDAGSEVYVRFIR